MQLVLLVGWQQVIVFLYRSCWRRGCVRQYESVCDRVYLYFTVSAMYVSYMNRFGFMVIYETVCALVWIVLWSCDIRVLIGYCMKNLGMVLNDSIRFIYDLDTVGLTRVDFTYGCIYGLLQSCTVAYTVIHGHGIRICFFFKSYTAYTNTLKWPECNSDNVTVSLVVCMVYKGGQPYKPCVLCGTGLTGVISIIPSCAHHRHIPLRCTKWLPEL
jgi:hypothetical protein